MKYVFLAFIAFLVLSCGTKPQIEEVNHDNIVSGEVTRPLIGADFIDTSAVIISYSFYSKIEHPYQDSINRKIAQYVQRITQFELSDEVRLLSTHFFEAQADSFVTIYNYEKEIDGMGGIWSLETSIQLNEDFKDFVELSLSDWSYTGGAHGNGSMMLYKIDRVTGNILTLSDLFSDLTALNAIAEKYFRAQHEMLPDEDFENAGFWFENNVFSVNNNFSISADFVTFHYNVYEIAPYAAGPIDLEIPMEDVKELLRRQL